MSNAAAAEPGSVKSRTSFGVRDLRKSYAGVPVLLGVDLEVHPGEIHALLGANGAGKSTLIKCVAGVTNPDSGFIDIEGQSYQSLTPQSSRAAGVAIIYQELSVAPTLSVTDNVFLGGELRAGPFIRRGAQAREGRRLLADFGVDIDGKTVLGNLGTAEAATVEIVKALRREPKVLILDEPTASLTQAEADQLADKMRKLRAAGVPLLYVTHRLDEVFALADRVSILRAGKIVLSMKVSECTPDMLVAAIVGRELANSVAQQPLPESEERPMLRIKDLVAPSIGPISIDIRPGEIVGVFGLVGSGRTELLETIFGGRLYGGSVELDGQALHLDSPADAVAAGLALVPSDRGQKGVFGGLSAQQNAVMPVAKKFTRFGFRRPHLERKAFEVVANALQLHPMNPTLEARRFSGGNQQKLVVGRWLHRQAGCRVLLLDEPTQGVDVGARADLYNAVRGFVGTTACALVASSEPSELQQLAHRVIVLSRGRIAASLTGSDITERRLLHLAHLSETPGDVP